MYIKRSPVVCQSTDSSTIIKNGILKYITNVAIPNTIKKNPKGVGSIFLLDSQLKDNESEVSKIDNAQSPWSIKTVSLITNTPPSAKM